MHAATDNNQSNRCVQGVQQGLVVDKHKENLLACITDRLPPKPGMRHSITHSFTFSQFFILSLTFLPDGLWPTVVQLLGLHRDGIDVWMLLSYLHLKKDENV